MCLKIYSRSRTSGRRKKAGKPETSKREGERENSLFPTLATTTSVTHTSDARERSRSRSKRGSAGPYLCQEEERRREGKVAAGKPDCCLQLDSWCKSLLHWRRIHFSLCSTHSSQLFWLMMILRQRLAEERMTFRVAVRQCVLCSVCLAGEQCLPSFFSLLLHQPLSLSLFFSLCVYM